MKHNIAVLASGGGSNLQALIDAGLPISLVGSDRPHSYALERANNQNIATVKLLSSEGTVDYSEFLEMCKCCQITWIVLAGYLRKVPLHVIEAYPRKIVNLHPSLLPKYGGKGFYGFHVHHAVKRAAETESGMTIHYVNHELDRGDIIFQKKILLDPAWTAEEIGAKILQLEHQYLPKIMKQLLEGK